MKALAQPFTIETHTGEIFGVLTSEGASKSKSSPTDELEFDTFEGTRSRPSDPIRL